MGHTDPCCTCGGTEGVKRSVRIDDPPSGYHLGMTEMATIKVPREVRDGVRTAARAAHLTQGQLIEEMLRDRRKAEFWSGLEGEVADEKYLRELADDDAALPDTEEQITRYEAGA